METSDKYNMFLKEEEGEFEKTDMIHRRRRENRYGLLKAN